MRIIIQIPKDKYRPGMEDKIKSSVEAATQEEISIRTVKR
jgi:hypothetical protein